MKKVCVSMMAVCLTVTGLLASPSPNDPPYFEQWPEEMVASHREAFKDAAKLREHLEHVTDPSRFEKTGWWLWEQDMKGFGQKFNVSDEDMEAALLDVYRTSPRPSVIRWLGFCAGEKGKKILWDVASDSTQDKDIRTCAINAYLCRADAQETRDVLVRFLIGDMREFRPNVTYQYAMYAFDTADDLKRQAILSSVFVALAREDNRLNFMAVDNGLAKRSKEYAESSQRLTILQRMNKLPPCKSYGDGSSLDPVIEPLKALPKRTNVSTNLTELMARDFRKPPEKPKP